MFEPELTEEELEFIEWLKNANYDELSGAMRDTEREIFREKIKQEA